jgi:hypothetical protein
VRNFYVQDKYDGFEGSAAGQKEERKKERQRFTFLV